MVIYCIYFFLASFKKANYLKFSRYFNGLFWHEIRSGIHYLMSRLIGPEWSFVHLQMIFTGKKGRGLGRG